MFGRFNTVQPLEQIDRLVYSISIWISLEGIARLSITNGTFALLFNTNTIIKYNSKVLLLD